jgi:hypothetical protein
MARSGAAAYEGTLPYFSIPIQEGDMPVDYSEVWAELGEEEARLMTQLNIVRQAKPAIQALLDRQALQAFGKPTAARFSGMGATKAIPLLLEDKTVPMTYREIHDALKAEGWTSNSSDSAATVSATLSQLRGSTVEKVGDGWRLMRVTVPVGEGITDDDIPF